MNTRAAAAAAATERILEAARRHFAAAPFDRVTLSEIAAEAHVGVQTLLRRFASKDELLAAVAQRRSADVRSIRDASPADNPATALRDLVETYERMGDEVLALLAQENRHPVVAAIVQSGRDYHHAWVGRIWVADLRALTRHDRKIRKAQLIAATDLCTWKIYRRDVGLDRRTAEAAMIAVCSSIVGQDRTAGTP